MIELSGVTRKYGEFTAVNDLNLTVEPSSGITAFLGPNGAGKSTTMRLMMGYLKPTSGSVRVLEKSLDDPDNLLEVRKRIGYLPETTPLYPEMLVSEYLQFMGGVRGLTGALLENRYREMVELLELGSHLYSPIGILSRGFRQRVALAGTLIHDPEVIILDEPTSGLDPNQISHIQDIIRKLGKNRTLILSTHILQEAEEMCNRVVIVNRGRIVADEDVSILTRGHSCMIVARGSDVEATLSSLPIVKGVRDIQKTLPEGYVQYVCDLAEDQPQKLLASVADRGWEIREFRPLSRSLHEIFQELTA